MRFTVQIILEDQSGNNVPYDSLCNNDRERVHDWAEDRLSEMRDECGSGSGSGFRDLINTILVDGCHVHFLMDSRTPNYFSDAELRREFSAEVSDGYMNDCSNDEIDLIGYTCGIYFTLLDHNP